MKNLQDRLVKRTDIDFMRRSLPGITVYMCIWPLLSWPLNYHEAHPVFTHTFAAILVIVGILRLLAAYSTQFIYAKYPKLWRINILGLSLIHGASLAALLVTALSFSKYTDMVLPIALIQATIISGAVSSLSPKPRFTQLYLSFLTVPIIIASAFHPEYSYLSYLFAVLWIYYIFLANRFSQEYQRAFHIEVTLSDNQKKLETLTITDALTGLYNRQYFDRTLDSQWDLASRSQSSLSILFLDIDFFKKVNDKYGHLVGDKALCHAANILKEITQRKSDMIARYGGEEFAIILPSTEHKDALILAENIRKRLENIPLISDDISINMTVSIGVNTIIPNNKSSNMEFVDNVDKALYAAKHTGRNKVMSFFNVAKDEDQ